MLSLAVFRADPLVKALYQGVVFCQDLEVWAGRFGLDEQRNEENIAFVELVVKLELREHVLSNCKPCVMRKLHSKGRWKKIGSNSLEWAANHYLRPFFTLVQNLQSSD